MRAVRADRLLAAAFALCACVAHAAEIGTLFHTAEERARLDRLRRGEPASATPEAGAAGPVRRELTGFVKRSDGRSTAFIDGVPVPVDPRAAPLLDPKSVRGFSPRDSEDLRVERKPQR
jgi:hypothetical protein